MTNKEALTILEKSEKCYTENCPDGVFCDECPWNVKTAEYDEAIKAIKNALSKQSASSEQADQAWEMLRDVHDMPDVPDKAKDIIGDVMLMLHQMKDFYCKYGKAK